MLRSRTSAALRLSLGVLAFLAACSSQAQAASAMGRAELSTAGPWEFPFDRTVELEKPLPEVNFFDSKVFNYSYYLAQNPNITTEGVFDYRSARNHWLHVGMFKGLQAAPGFDVKVYLAKNRDIERYFGPTNYPFAVIHYLSRGHLEKYRETGGPLETDIYSPLVFDHRYYTRKHSLVAPNTPTGYINESEARAHWREIGLPKGLQASSHFSPKTYLMLNPDVRTRYGADAYAAAVSHFISWGHKQTWRENGGTSCKYWATWCQVPDSAFTKLLKRVPRLPTFITNGTSISTPPIPSYAGRSVRINGRECSDLHGVERRSAAVSRVRDSISLSWPSYNGTRGCEITIRHFIDIQTRISNQRVPDLSLSHWAFDETIPSQVLDEPLPTPALLKYAGFSYAMPRPEKPKPKPLPDMSKVTLPLPEPSNATAPAAQNSTANSSSTNSSSNATAGANSTVTPIAPSSNASGPVVLMAPSSPEPTFHLSKAPSHFRVGISLLREQQMKDEDDVPADQKLKPTKVYSVVHHYELNPKGKVPEVQQKDGTVGVAGPAEMVDHFVAVDPSEEGKLGSDLLRFRRKNAIAQAAAQSQHHQRARHHRARRHKIHARHH